MTINAHHLTQAFVTLLMGVVRQYYGFRGALWELFTCFVLGTALAHQIRR